MIVLIEHDESGEIRSIACTASNEEGGMLRRVPERGYSIAEVETDIHDPRDIEGLRNIVRNYRVAGLPDEPRLARKSADISLRWISLSGWLRKFVVGRQAASGSSASF